MSIGRIAGPQICAILWMDVYCRDGSSRCSPIFRASMQHLSTKIECLGLQRHPTLLLSDLRFHWKFSTWSFRNLINMDQPFREKLRQLAKGSIALHIVEHNSCKEGPVQRIVCQLAEGNTTSLPRVPPSSKAFWKSLHQLAEGDGTSLLKITVLKEKREAILEEVSSTGCRNLLAMSGLVFKRHILHQIPDIILSTAKVTSLPGSCPDSLIPTWRLGRGNWDYARWWKNRAEFPNKTSWSSHNGCGAELGLPWFMSRLLLVKVASSWHRIEKNATTLRTKSSRISATTVPDINVKMLGHVCWHEYASLMRLPTSWIHDSQIVVFL